MNKRGWTLVQELVTFLIAVILLIYVVYSLNRMGLIRDMDEALPVGKPKLIVSGKVVSYDSVENDMKDAAKDYVIDKYYGNIDADSIVIRLSRLVKEGYMSTVRDSNDTCSGYVKVIKKDYNLKYVPYLKCSRFTTVGYEKEYD